MFEAAKRLAARVRERLGNDSRVSVSRTGEVTVEAASSVLHTVCSELCDGDGLQFRQLVDLCAVDYLDYGRADWETSESATGQGFSRGVQSRDPAVTAHESPRFAVVYHLLSHDLNQRIRIRCAAHGDPPMVESVHDIWSSADWYEREAFDLFGILFDGHPDLRRILTDYGFVGHPFRKDFPLTGEVEMRYDPARRRVVYEPVSIEPRTLVPKVIREDGQHQDGAGPVEAADA